MSGGRNIQTIDVLYCIHVKVLNSVRKKQIHTMMTLCGIARLIVRQSMFEFQFLLQIFGIKQIKTKWVIINYRDPSIFIYFCDIH